MNLFRSRGVDVFEAINKGDWQKVKDNVVQGKVRGLARGRENQASNMLFDLAELVLHGR